LQENYDVICRGQTEIIETLKNVYENLRKVDKNQTRIWQLLMQVTHKGKGPEKYENRETGGSHGGNRYNTEKAPKYNFEQVPYHQSKGSHGGRNPHEQMGSMATPRPYFPMFTDEQA
jgi:hypothetical protein